MTLAKAKELLSGRLEFGNPDQIRASNFIKESERIAEMIEAQEIKPFKCSMCNGTGEHECDCGDEHPCQSCREMGVKGIVDDALLKELETHYDAFMAAMEIVRKPVAVSAR